MARPKGIPDAEVLAEARRCFIQFGPGVSTERIAAGLNLSQPALFKRFGTKKALMLAALRPPPTPAWVVALDDGPDERSITHQLRDIVRRAAAFFEEVAPALAILHASGISREELLESYDVPPPVAAKAGLVAWLERAKGKGLIRDVGLEATASMIMGGLLFRVLIWKMTGVAPGGPLSPSYADDLADLLVLGLNPESAR
jgi:AcrR family transcriptional regulator